MLYSNIDFQKISEAISHSIDIVKNEQESIEAMEKLMNAQQELQQALSHSASMTK